MKERPILFKQPHADEMVRAILDGRKTQTRRLIKPQPEFGLAYWGGGWDDAPVFRVRTKEGNQHHCDPVTFAEKYSPLTVGDRLWVREAFAAPWGKLHEKFYRADDPKVYKSDGAWTPSIHMPRWASRIDLEITRVWVERVQDMEGMDAASSDALKEGVHRIHHEGGNYYYSAFRNHPHPQNWTDPFLAFRELWQSIYGTWDSNPFVWAYEFRRIKP